MRTPQHLVLLLKDLYEISKAMVTVGDGNSIPFNIQRGGILSPLLFNIYGECMIRKAVNGLERSITTGGRKINNLRYADDTRLIAKDKEEMSDLIKKVESTQCRNSETNKFIWEFI